MKIEKTIHVVDAHTAAQAIRVVIGGMPVISGSTIQERQQYMLDHYDHLRTAIMCEPRGGDIGAIGAILLPPISSQASYSVLFPSKTGYLTMCGDAVISLSTVLVETGMVDVKEPYTEIVLETPNGLVTTKVLVENNEAKEVSFVNSPSFLFQQKVAVDTPWFGTIHVDVAFGGSFFAIVQDEELGFQLERSTVLKKQGELIELMHYLRNGISVSHPVLPIHHIDMLQICGKPTLPEAFLQNALIGNNGVDRSPCGTGSSAKAATMFNNGQLAVGDVLTVESLANTLFKVRIVEEQQVGAYHAIVPEISGSAFITAFSMLVINSNDPIKYGFNM